MRAERTFTGHRWLGEEDGRTGVVHGDRGTPACAVSCSESSALLCCYIGAPPIVAPRLTSVLVYSSADALTFDGTHRISDVWI